MSIMDATQEQIAQAKQISEENKVKGFETEALALLASQLPWSVVINQLRADCQDPKLLIVVTVQKHLALTTQPFGEGERIIIPLCPAQETESIGHLSAF